MAKYVGADLVADITIDYEYMGHDFDDFEGVENLLSLNLDFARDTSNYATNVEMIGQQAVKYAQSFLRQNGNYRTGALHDSIRFEQDASDGSRWTLSAPARDKRGHPYAGHIEYGFTDRSGQGRGPWPFLRPAMRMAAADSRGELADMLAWAALYGQGQSDRWHPHALSSTTLALGRSGNMATNSRAASAVGRTRNAFGSNSKSTSWKTAYNGFNKDSSRNEWSITNDNAEWFFGEV